MELELQKYINNPKDSLVCFNLGYEYEKLGQTASACGFYLRATEFSNDVQLNYEALLRMALCFERQGDRWFMIKGLILRAISLLPNRPEGHFLLCRTYERCKDWQEGYTHSVIGLKMSIDIPYSKTDLEYPGIFGFDFQRGVCAWWIGLFDESMSIMKELDKQIGLPQIYINAIKGNLKLSVN